MDDTTEVFRQAVTSTMRAISGNDELSVTFGRGKPYMQGSKARLPAPEAGLGEEGLAVLRGTADRFALKSVTTMLAYILRNVQTVALPKRSLMQWKKRVLPSLAPT